jgi:uncharacterized protein (TIGR02246 family)
MQQSGYLVAVVATLACSSRPESSNSSDVALRATIDSAATRLLSALRTDNADSLLALMADDVVLMPPNEGVLKGRAEVRAWYDRFRTQMRTTSLTIGDREVLVADDWATEIATFEWTLAPTAGGSPVSDRGSYIQVWRRQPDGRWLFSREVWNSTAPLAVAAQGM